MPAYPSVLKLGREREDAILLDIGCCFGNDVRKAVADGWPVQNVIASDLQQGFWDIGHELFKTTPETFPAAFIAGDVFDLISPRVPFTELPQTPRPDLGSLNTLTSLQGHLSAIFAGSFFHLFDERRQLELACLLASLLSPQSGSIIFGAHLGLPEKGIRADFGYTMFCHSPESWRELWEGQVFERNPIQVEARLHKVEGPDIAMGAEVFMLLWTITRL